MPSVKWNKRCFVGRRLIYSALRPKEYPPLGSSFEKCSLATASSNFSIFHLRQKGKTKKTGLQEKPLGVKFAQTIYPRRLSWRLALLELERPALPSVHPAPPFPWAAKKVEPPFSAPKKRSAAPIAPFCGHRRIPDAIQSRPWADEFVFGAPACLWRSVSPPADHLLLPRRKTNICFTSWREENFRNDFSS